ncbi:MAG TPA: hypothetical protein VKT72_01010 [Candidatus Baltobacteraceae bacterium]|nr:hypothetical protein [Candidatus Baltobacteraceae bacterium]
MAFFLSLLWAVFSTGVPGFGMHVSHAPAAFQSAHHGNVHVMDGSAGGPV